MTKEMLLADLSRIAHELWRLRLLEEGWSLGPYMPEDKNHDALLAFEQLSRGDRMALDLHIVAERLEERLTKQLDYPRGPGRPFLLEEMVVGLTVTLEDHGFPERQDDVTDAIRGTVIAWSTDDSGELQTMSVRWHDGEVCEYHPWSGELVRIADLK